MPACYTGEVSLSYFWRVAGALSLLGCSDAIAPNDTPPRAVAGFDQYVLQDQTVVLDGLASIPGSAQIDAYRWTLIVQPETSVVALSDSDRPIASFVPDALGVYIVTLVVRAGDVSSTPDTLVITAEEGNQPPIVVPACGPDTNCMVLHGQNAPLDGRASTDPEGDPFTVQWRQLLSADECMVCPPTFEPCAPSDTEVVVSDSDLLLASFTAPDAAELSLVFALEATDGVRTVSDCVAYTSFNTAPVVQIASSSSDTNPAEVDEGTLFVLSASPTFDPDPPDTLSFSWTQTGGTPSAFAGTLEGSLVQVTAPTVDVPRAQLIFEVSVTDGIDQVSAQITVTVVNL